MPVNNTINSDAQSAAYLCFCTPVMANVSRQFMHYGITRAATNFTQSGMTNWGVKVIKVLLFFIPRANPDNERLYPEVRAWALELSESGLPQREVGVSGSGEALFCAPNSRNTGFWTDMANHKFNPDELEKLTEEGFIQLWNAAQVRRSSS